MNSFRKILLVGGLALTMLFGAAATSQAQSFSVSIRGGDPYYHDYYTPRYYPPPRRVYYVPRYYYTPRRVHRYRHYEYRENRRGEHREHRHHRRHRED